MCHLQWGEGGSRLDPGSARIVNVKTPHVNRYHIRSVGQQMVYYRIKRDANRIGRILHQRHVPIAAAGI